MLDAAHLPDDNAALKAMLLAREAALQAGEARVAHLSAELSTRAAEIEHLNLVLAKLRRMQFGRRSEKLDQQIEQVELKLEDLETEAAVAEAQAPVEMAPRRKAERKPLPPHLPREDRVLLPSSEACPECGGKLKDLGEDVSEQLEYVPASFRVIRHVRPKLACACCDRIVQAPAASRPIERGLPGPGLLAHVLVAKYADHVPLYRQSVIYAREGVELERSLLASCVGAAGALLRPLSEALRRHVFAAAKLHGDDTPLPLLAPGNAGTGQRQDAHGAPVDLSARRQRQRRHRAARRVVCVLAAPQGGTSSSALGRLYRRAAGRYVCRRQRRLRQWARRRGGVLGACAPQVYDLHVARPSPLTAEALRRIGELYAIEESIRGKPPDERLVIRQARAKPLLDDMELWLHATLATLSRKSDTAAAILYALELWPALIRYADDGRIEIDNSAAERALRGVALGRRNFLFAGADSGGERVAAMYGLIGTAKLNGVDPKAWLRDVLERIAGHPVNRVHDFLPWNLADTLAATPVTRAARVSPGGSITSSFAHGKTGSSPYTPR